jgi:hypothetical protein
VGNDRVPAGIALSTRHAEDPASIRRAALNAVMRHGVRAAAVAGLRQQLGVAGHEQHAHGHLHRSGSTKSPWFRNFLTMLKM